MDYNSILKNIKSYLDNASPEEMAEIDEVIASESEEDITFEEYIDAISGQYFYTIEESEDSPCYVSDIASLKSNALEYRNVPFSMEQCS